MRRVKILMVVTLMFGASGVFAQDSTYLANEYMKGLSILKKAQAFADIDMEKKALYELLVLNESDTVVLKELTRLYFDNGQYSSAVLVGLDYLKRYPNSVYALEVCAHGYEQVGLIDKAVTYYEQLYMKTDNREILYQVAFLQFTMKRFNESLNNIAILESSTKGDFTLEILKQNNEAQTVPIKAALLNLKGLISLNQGNKEEAKSFFSEALKILPDFQTAQVNLAEASK